MVELMKTCTNLPEAILDSWSRRRNSSQGEDPSRIVLSPQPVGNRDPVSPASSTSIDPRFRLHDLDMVGQHVSTDHAERISRGDASLTQKINQIGDLRIAQPDSGCAAALASEVDTAERRGFPYRSMSPDPPGEIDIFLPTIERQVFIEAQGMRRDRRHTEGHIATIRSGNGQEACLVRGSIAVIKNGQSFPRTYSWPVDAIGKKFASQRDQFWIGQKYLLHRSQVSCTDEEIIVEENDNVSIVTGGENTIPLRWKTDRS